MKHSISPSTNFYVRLTLADCSNWDIIPNCDNAFKVVLDFAKIMRLKQHNSITNTGYGSGSFQRIYINIESCFPGKLQNYNKVHIKVKDVDNVVCTNKPEINGDTPVQLLIHLSMVICREMQSRGGILLHGALAALDGKGVIFAGPGGRGKTTASQRLPCYWRQLCDDTTLVVCDNRGLYWAHPWPTWSNFMFKRSGGSWNVEHAVPLRGIFFLEQNLKDDFEPLGIAQNVCLLNASAEQASWLTLNHTDKDTIRKIRQQRFDNICLLAQSVPSYVLRFSRKGAFWNEIERALYG